MDTVVRLICIVFFINLVLLFGEVYGANFRNPWPIENHLWVAAACVVAAGIYGHTKLRIEALHGLTALVSIFGYFLIGLVSYGLWIQDDDMLYRISSAAVASFLAIVMMQFLKATVLFRINHKVKKPSQRRVVLEPDLLEPEEQEKGGHITWSEEDDEYTTR